MTNKKKIQETPKYKTAKDFLETYPKPPPEHTSELKMEKRLKRILKEMEEKKEE